MNEPTPLQKHADAEARLARHIREDSWHSEKFCGVRVGRNLTYFQYTKKPHPSIR